MVVEPVVFVPTLVAALFVCAEVSCVVVCDVALAWLVVCLPVLLCVSTNAAAPMMLAMASAPTSMGVDVLVDFMPLA